MRLLPRKNAARITFCLVHAAQWAEHAEALNLDPLKVVELQNRIEAARLAFLARGEARDAARSATLRMNMALEEMTTLAAALVSQVRATAATGGEGIYALASLPVPDKRSKMAKPGTPTAFTAELQPVGWLVLRWTCRNPRGAVGTMYQVHRRLQSADGRWGPREFLGVAGKKAFTDATLPPGNAAAEYHVRAVRSTAFGSEASHTVSFGTTFRAGAPSAMQLAA